MDRGIGIFIVFFLAGLVRADPAGPVTWGAEVLVSHGGWGRMIPLGGREWLAVSTTYPSGEPSRLRLYRSRDDGRTWTRISELGEPGRTLDNGDLVGLDGGAILLTMRSLIDGSSYRLPVYRSEDRGATWTYLSDIDATSGSSRGLWEPHLYVLPDGTLTAMYSDETHAGYSQVVSERVSTDAGATWGPEGWVAAEPGGGGLRPGMAVMDRMADGRHIVVYEVVGVGNADVHLKFSKDGIRWPPGLGTRIPCQHCGPFVEALPDGRVFVSSCSSEVSYSETLGETWQLVRPPAWGFGFQFAWPAIYPVRPGELGVMVASGGVRIRFGALSARAVWPDSFHEDFDGASDAGWARYGGSFGFADGAYVLSNDGAHGKALTGDETWRDGTLEAQALLRTPGNAGLLFRATNPDIGGPDAVRGYYAGLDSDGFVVLGAMDGTWRELARAPVEVDLGVWTYLRVEMDASSIGVYAGPGTLRRISVSDDTHPRGLIGVRSFGCEAWFDDVSFWNASQKIVGTGTGLRARYFAGPDLSTCRLSRIDPVVDFDWGTGAAFPIPDAESLGVRWTGQVQAPASESFTFHVAHEGGARLWVGGRLLVDAGSPARGAVDAGSVALEAGRKYDLRLDYFSPDGRAAARLAWSGPSTPWSIIPASQLYPSAEADDCGPPFHRGDPNSSGACDISDAVHILAFLFLGAPGPSCREAADANDDGAIDVSDPVWLLNWLFTGGPPPAAPGPPDLPCGPDPAGSPGKLGCEEYGRCAP